VDRARLLRKKATQPERILWRHLRNRNFAGYKFRRQHPFEDYVLDFYCPGAKLAIELDGGGHNYRAGQIRDRTRSEFLARHGVIVLRFWNHQIRRELDSVLRAIWFALGERQQTNPHLHPLPLEKGEAKLTHVLFAK
jgi:very-short-patch-repair endonuclease